MGAEGREWWAFTPAIREGEGIKVFRGGGRTTKTMVLARVRKALGIEPPIYYTRIGGIARPSEAVMAIVDIDEEAKKQEVAG